MSARAIARELEAQKPPTPKGGAWHAATVLRIMKRLEAADWSDIASLPSSFQLRWL
jgi:Recombinase